MARPAPREYLLDVRLFGRDPSAPWRPAEHLDDAARIASAYTQHLVACAVTAELHRRGQTRAGLAARVGVRADNLRRKLAGEYWVTVDDLPRWVLALEDVTLLPTPQAIGDLLPPTLPGQEHSFVDTGPSEG
jgi:hypothetical protein